MRCAIVTGAGTGIGRAIALKLAGMGHALVLAGRRTAPLQEVADLIRKTNGRAEPVAADVTQEDAVQRLVARAMDAFQRVDVLVNNAGMALMRPLGEMTGQEWRDTLESNVSSAFYATRAVWPIMRAQNSGRSSTSPRWPARTRFRAWAHTARPRRR